MEFVGTAEEYNAQYVEIGRERPVRCLGCAGTEINGHGSYERWVVYVDRDVLIVVRRWRCKSCGKTISMLPSVVHRYRQYALSVIETVLQGRLSGGSVKTWRCAAIETGASVRSLRRWCEAFVMNALRWLSAVWTVLVIAMPETLSLNAHGQARDVAQALLSSSIDLIRWMNASQATETALRVMWCTPSEGCPWGWNAGVGRLI